MEADLPASILCIGLYSLPLLILFSMVDDPNSTYFARYGI
jgi:hypothetical protein